MSLFSNLFGGGGGGDGGLGAFLAFQREEQRRLKLEGERAEEFATELTSFRRGVLADRTGFAGTVNVGPAVRETDARLARRMALLAEDDPTRIAFNESLAAERKTRVKALRTISGEEFKLRDRIAELQGRVKSAKIGDIDSIITSLEAVNTERGGRNKGREDTAKALDLARKRKRQLEIQRKRARDRGSDRDFGGQ